MRPSLPLGSYVAARTPLHLLDARVKLALLLAGTIALFATRAPAVVVAGLGVALVATRVSGMELGTVLRGLRPMAVILLFSLLSNSLVVDGSGDVALAGMLGLSLPGLARGLLVVVRIAALVALSLSVTASTSSTEVADALSGLLRPLGRVGLPVGDIAMTVSVALRFIPLTAEELGRIRDAQRARGVDFDAGTVPVRVRRWLSVLTPLVVALFRRADELACAMRERGYRGEGRTRLVHRMCVADVLVLVAGLIACIGACLV